jgi:hypothetical protein
VTPTPPEYETFDEIVVRDENGVELLPPFYVPPHSMFSIDETTFQAPVRVERLRAAERTPPPSDEVDETDAPVTDVPVEDGPQELPDESDSQEKGQPERERRLSDVTFTPSWLHVHAMHEGPLRGVQFTIHSKGSPNVLAIVPDAGTLALIAEVCLSVADVAHPGVMDAYTALRNGRTGELL